MRTRSAGAGDVAQQLWLTLIDADSQPRCPLPAMLNAEPNDPRVSGRCGGWVLSGTGVDRVGRKASTRDRESQTFAALDCCAGGPHRDFDRLRKVGSRFHQAIALGQRRDLVVRIHAGQYTAEIEAGRIGDAPKRCRDIADDRHRFGCRLTGKGEHVRARSRPKNDQPLQAAHRRRRQRPGPAATGRER